MMCLLFIDSFLFFAYVMLAKISIPNLRKAMLCSHISRKWALKEKKKAHVKATVYTIQVYKTYTWPLMVHLSILTLWSSAIVPNLKFMIHFHLGILGNPSPHHKFSTQVLFQKEEIIQVKASPSQLKNLHGPEAVTSKRKVRVGELGSCGPEPWLRCCWLSKMNENT